MHTIGAQIFLWVPLDPCWCSFFVKFGLDPFIFAGEMVEKPSRNTQSNYNSLTSSRANNKIKISHNALANLSLFIKIAKAGFSPHLVTRYMKLLVYTAECWLLKQEYYFS